MPNCIEAINFVVGGQTCAFHVCRYTMILRVMLIVITRLDFFYFIILQENVSCLNTSLVFLMFSLDKGYLPLYLKAFRSEEAALKKPGYILDNLR